MKFLRSFSSFHSRAKDVNKRGYPQTPSVVRMRAKAAFRKSLASRAASVMAMVKKRRTKKMYSHWKQRFRNRRRATLVKVATMGRRIGYGMFKKFL